MAVVRVDVLAETAAARAELDQFARSTDTNTKKISQSWKTAGTAIKVAAASTGALLVLNFGRDALAAGEAARLGAAKAQTAFGDWTDSVASWSDEVNERYGVANDAMLNLAASVGTMVRAQGLSSESAADFSTKLITLAGDLDLVNDSTSSIGEATDALSAGLRGEFDSMEKLGLSIKQSDVNARLLAEGNSQLTGEALKAATAAAFLALAQESAATQMAALTSETVDQQLAQNEVSAAYDEAKTEVGKLVSEGLGMLALWIVNTGIPTIKDWAKAIGDASKDVSEWWKRTMEDTEDLRTDLKEFGEDVVEIWDGMTAAARDFWDAMLKFGEFMKIWSDRIKGFFREVGDAAGDMREKIKGAFEIPGAGALLGGIVKSMPGGAFLGPLFGAATGGIVPGPLGAPRLIVAHGGEPVGRIAAQQAAGTGGGLTVNLTVNAGLGVNGDELGGQLVELIAGYERRNGRASIGGA